MESPRPVADLPFEGQLPSLSGATGWLNSPPLTAAGLRGSVVLVNFWTYTCINYRFHARDLHLVMGPAARGTSLRCRVLVDGQPPGAAHGSDVDDQGNATVADQRLYQLVRQRGPVTERTFEVTFLDPGVQAYAFTFG